MMLKTTNQSRRLAHSAVFAALLCILSPVAVPAGPVPVTLSLFAVLLTGMVLEWKQAASAVLVYILLGLAGMPVFSGGGSGFGVILGPTGGYIWCYLPAAALVSRFGRGVRTGRALAVSAGAVVLCYLLGTLQFTLVMKRGWLEALGLCVWPFVPFDLMKIVCAVLLGGRLRRQLQAAGMLK